MITIQILDKRRVLEAKNVTSDFFSVPWSEIKHGGNINGGGILSFANYAMKMLLLQRVKQTKKKRH